MLKKLLQLLFPLRCTICNNIGFFVCDSCTLPIEIYADDTLTCVFNYQNAHIKSCILRLKEHADLFVVKKLCTPLAELLYEELHDEQNWTGAKSVVVIPIPARLERMQTYGFNQAALCAAELAKQLNVTCLPVLKRTDKKIIKQASIKNKGARAENIKGSFYCDDNYKEIISKSICIVVDDVATSGSTLNEASRALLEGAAGCVLLCALAHQPLTH